MSKRLDEVIDTSPAAPDNLIAGINPPAEIFSVTVKSGQGELKRGSLLALNEGKYELISETTTGKANAVLAETVDTGSEPSQDVEGIAYRTGHFNGNVLVVSEGYSITDNEKETLRGVGILLSDAVK